jgi:L-asparagine transporter-like permease
MQSSNSGQALIKAAQALFYLNAMIWFAFGLATLIRIGNGNNAHRLAALILTLFMLANVAAMLVSGWGLGTRNKWLYLLAIAVILVNIILTFTDQFGLLDFLTLVVDVVILVLLIAIRGRY